MKEDFSINEMKFLHVGDGTKVDFSNSKEVMTLLGYNKENNDLLNIDAVDLYENMLQDGARIIITKNTKDKKFVINHAYDATLLANIQGSLQNILKTKPSDCASSCDNKCMDFCSYNCSSSCGSAVSKA